MLPQAKLHTQQRLTRLQRLHRRAQTPTKATRAHVIQPTGRQQSTSHNRTQKWYEIPHDHHQAQPQSSAGQQINQTASRHNQNILVPVRCASCHSVFLGSQPVVSTHTPIRFLGNSFPNIIGLPLVGSRRHRHINAYCGRRNRRTTVALNRRLISNSVGTRHVRT